MSEKFGFYLLVSSAEMVQHCRAKAEANRERAAFLESKSSEIRARGPRQDSSTVLEELGANREAVESMLMPLVHGGTAVLEQIFEQVASGIRGRKAAAQTFDFFADHVESGTTFRLSLEDAEKLELVEGRFVSDNMLYAMPRHFRSGIR